MRGTVWGVVATAAAGVGGAEWLMLSNAAVPVSMLTVWCCPPGCLMLPCLCDVQWVFNNPACNGFTRFPTLGLEALKYSWNFDFQVCEL